MCVRWWVLFSNSCRRNLGVLELFLGLGPSLFFTSVVRLNSFFISVPVLSDAVFYFLPLWLLPLQIKMPRIFDLQSSQYSMLNDVFSPILGLSSQPPIYEPAVEVGASCGVWGLNARLSFEFELLPMHAHWGTIGGGVPLTSLYGHSVQLAEMFCLQIRLIVVSVNRHLQSI